MKVLSKYTIVLISLFLLAVAILSISIGSISIPISKLLSQQLRGLLYLRISRTLLALIAGASLAVVGAVLQGLLKNPLADPYVLGISSGSGLGAVVAILFGINLTFLGSFSLPLCAFIGGALTIIFVYILSKKGPKVGLEDLLLSGVIVTAMLSGLIMFIVTAIESEGMHSALWWLLGNTQIYDLKLLIFVSVVSILGIVISMLLSRNLNVMSLGEEEAVAMGLNVERIKIIFFILTSMMTAVVVSVCGMIGFVGLIIPHAARRLVGPDHRQLIPASALLGGAFLIISDIFARKIMSPMELPVGVVTALIGAPFFIILLKKARRPGWK